MRADFPRTHQILLEQNYRSTGGILALSLAIVAQGKPMDRIATFNLISYILSDQSRISKSLHTAHPRGMLPVLQRFDNERAEGRTRTATQTLC